VTQFVIERPPRNDLELWWSVRAVWGIQIPRVKVCDHHDTPFDAFKDAFFARHPQAMWLGSRGFSGKTFTLSLLGMMEMTFLGAEVSVLGGSGAQALRVQASMNELWHKPGAPKHLLEKPPTKYDTELTNGGKARTLMASQTSVRGPHPSRLRIDEIDEADLDIITAALGQPMRGVSRNTGERIETNTVFSSTHTYPDGPVTYFKRDFQDKGWPVFSWCYLETQKKTDSKNEVYDGWLDPEEVQRKRSEIPSQMWKNEYDILEPNFEGRAIDEESVDRMFDPRWNIKDGAEAMYYRFLRARPDRDYITGVDWAKQQDFTVIITWDTTVYPWKMAAFERINRRPWPAMIGRLNKRWAEYGGLVVSDNTGIGGVVNDYIEYPPGAYKDHLTELTMAGKIRSDMVTEMVQGVENGNFLAPRLKWMYDEFRFVTPDNLYNNSSSSHLPDSIAATALAWTARKRNAARGVQIISITRDSSPWKI
jgi:hypothetical protein